MLKTAISVIRCQLIRFDKHGVRFNFSHAYYVANLTDLLRADPMYDISWGRT